MTFLERLLDGAEVEWVPLDKAASIVRGKRLVRSQLEQSGEYPVYQNSMTPLGYYHESNVKAGTTFIIAAGAAGEIGYSDSEFWAADDIYSLIPNEGVKDKFLYYFLLTIQHKISSRVRRASVPRLSRLAVKNLIIPIPCSENPKRSLGIQTEIVRILDNFSELNDKLNAELNARRKQYEYYRDSILSFDSIRYNVTDDRRPTTDDRRPTTDDR